MHKFVRSLKLLDGDVRIVMEHTGAYYLPVATVLSEAGFFVSIVHAKLVHDFGNNSIRHGKTDRYGVVKGAERHIRRVPLTASGLSGTLRAVTAFRKAEASVLIDSEPGRSLVLVTLLRKLKIPLDTR